MLQTLKSEFERQKEILKRKSAVSTQRLSKVKLEIESLEDEVRDNEAKVSIASKHDVNSRDTFIINGNPICPVCLAIKNVQDLLTPINGTDKYDIYECKSCGYELKVEA